MPKFNVGDRVKGILPNPEMFDGEGFVVGEKKSQVIKNVICYIVESNSNLFYLFSSEFTHIPPNQKPMNQQQRIEAFEKHLEVTLEKVKFHLTLSQPNRYLDGVQNTLVEALSLIEIYNIKSPDAGQSTDVK